MMGVDGLHVSICVLTYNRRDLLKILMKQLCELKYRPLEIVVVDNHSDDGTERMIKEDFSDVIYIRTERNIGVAARNLAMKFAKGGIVITLDDDVRGIRDEEIGILCQKFARDPYLGVINFRVLNQSGHICNWVHHCKEEDFYDKEFLTYEITEGAVAFRKQSLELAGYYSTDFFLSHEGPDLAFRIFEKGYKVIYSGDIAVTHYFAEANREPWRNYYYDTRNQFWLVARNFPFGYAMKYLTRGLLSMLVYSIRDGYMVYWIKGVADGIKGLKRALQGRSAVSQRTMCVIRSVDSYRPPIAYSLKKRVFGKKDLLFD